MPHNLDRNDVDMTQLAQELGQRLGRPVALSGRPPGQTGGDGAPLPGTLLVLDPRTGSELTVDGRTVLGAVRAHVPPPTAAQRRAAAITAAERKATSGDTAGALTDLIALLRDGG